MPDTQADPAAAPPPQPGEVRAVRPGLLRARMPLPFPPSHVNIWFLEHEGGWLAVDASVSNRTARELWDRVLAAPELGGKPLTGLLVTPDDPAALAEALVALLSDPGRAQTMGTAGATWLATEASWPVVGRKVHDALETARTKH